MPRIQRHDQPFGDRGLGQIGRRGQVPQRSGGAGARCEFSLADRFKRHGDLGLGRAGAQSGTGDAIGAGQFHHHPRPAAPIMPPTDRRHQIGTEQILGLGIREIHVFQIDDQPDRIADQKDPIGHGPRQGQAQLHVRGTAQPAATGGCQRRRPRHQPRRFLRDGRRRRQHQRQQCNDQCQPPHLRDMNSCRRASPSTMSSVARA